NGWLLFAESRPQVDGHKLEDVTSKQLAGLSCGHFQCHGQSLQSDRWELTVESEAKKGDAKGSRQVLVLESRGSEQLNDSNVLKCTAFPELDWTVDSAKVEEKWIQLIEKEGGDDTGKSDLDYFFDDNQNIKILDSTQRKFDDGFRVLKARQDE